MAKTVEERLDELTASLATLAESMQTVHNGMQEMKRNTQRSVEPAPEPKKETEEEETPDYEGMSNTELVRALDKQLSKRLDEKLGTVARDTESLKSNQRAEAISKQIEALKNEHGAEKMKLLAPYMRKYLENNPQMEGDLAGVFAIVKDRLPDEAREKLTDMEKKAADEAAKKQQDGSNPFGKNFGGMTPGGALDLSEEDEEKMGSFEASEALERAFEAAFDGVDLE